MSYRHNRSLPISDGKNPIMQMFKNLYYGSLKSEIWILLHSRILKNAVTILLDIINKVFITTNVS